MSRLTRACERSAASAAKVTFITEGGLDTTSWAQVHLDARRFAAGLLERDVGPGTAVALLGPTSRHLVTALQACWLVGAIPQVLPLPSSRFTDVEAIWRRRLRRAGTEAVLRAGGIDASGLECPSFEIAEFERTRRLSDLGPDVVDDEQPALLQFSSGSTGEPTAIHVRHGQLALHTQSIRDACGADEEDVWLSWLPLFHDMGLVGFLSVPMTCGLGLAIAPTSMFASRPSRWLDWISALRPTAICAPDSAYGVSTKVMANGWQGDLSSVRLAFNGSEPIDALSFQAFLDAAASRGMSTSAAYPVYGLAEATLAVTFPSPGSGMLVDSARGRYLVACGHPIPGVEVEVRCPRPGDVGDAAGVGAVHVRGRSVCTVRPPSGGAGSAADDGWLDTGDLGYWHQGQLVICGRSKNVIIVGGRKYWPQEIERIATRVPGVRPGCAIAFGVQTGAREAVVIAVEVQTTEGDPRSEIKRAVRGAVGVRVEDVVLLEAGQLPKTTSGKLRHAEMRDLYVSNRL